MNLFLSLYLAALFVALTPGVLLTLPKGGARITVAVVHALVFAVIYHFTKDMVTLDSFSMDGFQNSYNPNQALQYNNNLASLLQLQAKNPNQVLQYNNNLASLLQLQAKNRK